MTDRDKLIGLLGNLSISCEEKIGCINCKYNKEMCCKLKREADYLLQNGVIVPPCKVGDTLYVISQMKDKRILPFINEYEATSIKLGKKKCVVYHEKDGYIKIFKQDDFGKTVFLTREEAEKALKERETE